MARDVGQETLWRRLASPESADEAKRLLPRLAEAALIDRRMAMRLMGASAALSLASGCGSGASPDGSSRRAREIRNVRTTLDMNGLGFGVVVKTADGLPVKIEGDPHHPASLGRSNVFAQAAVLSYYDPERPDRPFLRGGGVPARLTQAMDRLGRSARASRGGGMHILIEPAASPTLERVVGEAMAALPHARFYAHRPFPVAPLVADGLAEAELIVSIGADFLGPGPMQVRHAADFAAGRKVALDTGRPHRLVVIESVPTLTGARADTRIVADPHRMAKLGAALSGNAAGDEEAVRLADDLRSAGSRAVMIVGDSMHPAHRPLWESVAGRYGIRTAQRTPVAPLEGLPGIGELAGALAAGDVGTLVMLGGNPAYTAPGATDFERLAKKAGHSLYLGPEANETARLANLFLPGRPHLASWGDLRAFDGSVSLVRPVAPGLGETAAGFLSRLAGQARGDDALVAETHDASPEAIRAEDFAPSAPALAAQGRATPKSAAPPAHVEESGLMLIAMPDATVWDGSLAANGWAQELPDPITGLSWGNALTISAALAERQGLNDGDEVEVRSATASLTVPVKVLPGQSDGVVALPLGYGRRIAGVGSGIGASAYRLLDGPYLQPVSLRATGGRSKLVSANPYEVIDDVEAVRWVAPDDPPLRSGEHQTATFAKPERTAAKQWGMVIDLDACIGCNACTIACQAENNIPIVGPEETAAGRALHWLRVDRYHRGPAENPQTAFQPVPCMHCETAPCEPVCPVAATTHSSEGLNQMTYQRCIGTRSCSNNCPYKVRKFNWFDYTPEPGNRSGEGANPRVSIRERGVMEKCTFCVQRIEEARLDNGATPVTACQQTCPTQAITFGDLADGDDPVSVARASPRNYDLLGGLNLGPRTTYLARVDTAGRDD